MSGESFELLLEKYLAGALSEGERVEFRARLNAEPELRERLQRELSAAAALRRLYSTSFKTSGKNKKGEAMNTAMQALNEVPMQPMQAMKGGARNGRRPARVESHSRVLAAAVFLVLCAGLYFIVRRPDSSQALVVAPVDSHPVTGDQQDGQDGEKAPKPADADLGSAPRAFISGLKFKLYAQDSGETFLGATPTARAGGIPLPAKGSWYVEYDAKAGDTPILIAAALCINKVPDLHIRCKDGADEIARDVIMYMSGNFMSSAVPKGLAYGSPDLKSLTVSGFALSRDDIDNIMEFKSLEQLVCRQADMPDAVAASLAKLKRLRSLSISGTFSTHTIELLAGLPELQELNLQDSTVEASTAGELQALHAKLSELRELWVGQDTQPVKDIAELRAALPKVEVNGFPPYSPDEPTRDEIVTKALATLQAAITESPEHYEAPDKWLLSKLKRRISFEFVDMPAAEALKKVELHCGVPILIDPGLSMELPAVNLKVTNMTCDLALDWIAKLAGLEKVARGPVIVLTSKDRAKKLRCQRYPLNLSAESEEAAWNMDELKRVGSIIAEFPIECSSTYEGGVVYRRVDVSSYGARLDQERNVKATIDVDSRGWAAAERFIEAFKHPATLGRKLPPWVAELEKALDQPAAVQKETIRNALPRLSKAHGVPLSMIATNIQDTDTDAKGSLRDVLLKISEQTHLAIQLSPDGVVLTDKAVYQQTLARPVVIDLKPALQAGLKSGELLDAITALSDLARQKCRPVIVRDRCVGMFDPWALHSIAVMLDASIAKGRLQPAEAPWFYASYKQIAAEAAPQNGNF